jgi:hypothetical protein
MTTQVMFLLVAGAAMILAVFAAIREKQRLNRPNLDQVGWVPWNLLQILGGIVAVVAIVLAFKIR